jgi:hypothetical protein
MTIHFSEKRVRWLVWGLECVFVLGGTKHQNAPHQQRGVIGQHHSFGAPLANGGQMK